MKVTVDTNVLVRALMRDDVDQAEAAAQVLSGARVIAVTLPCLCELVWVLRRVYRFPVTEVATAIRVLANTANVVTNRPAVEAGLALLEAGGDFADGVIAWKGQWLGGETFVSFDRQAVALLSASGQPARLP